MQPVLGRVPSFLNAADGGGDGQRASLCYVITGSASGLGLATARLLAHEGYTVVGCDRDGASLDSISDELGSHFKPLLCDITDPQSMRTAAATLTHMQPDGIDAILHFAGMHSGGPLMELAEHEFAAVVDVNLTGVWRTQKTFFPLLKARRGRTIIVSSEVAHARFSHAFSGAYSLSKIALDNMAVTLRQELALLEPRMDVVVLHLGQFTTPLLTRAAGAYSTFLERKPDSDFAPAMEWTAGLVSWYTRTGQSASTVTSPEIVARKVLAVLSARKPRKIYSVGVSPLMRIVAWIPSAVLDSVIISKLRATIRGNGGGAFELVAALCTAMLGIL
mmetsp:Transcript_25814/g.69751  ORF Transcript_25814/g.69751 Transcript_25814/m.69751 type:complete len:333 (+) Transcript_25814:67-1065(+)